MFFNWFGGVQPLTDIVMVSVLQPEVVLLQDVHLIVDLLQQLLSGGLFLKIIHCKLLLFLSNTSEDVHFRVTGAW